jgi:ribulose 1,5-bisphosphate synthetase/thiazole synthase
MAQFLVRVLLIQLGITTIISAHPSANFAQVKRSVHELNEYYDYIVIGGGTAGLTVANRLTEDSSSTSIPSLS